MYKLIKPKSPYFSSGPCKKYPDYSKILSTALIHRSCKSKESVERINNALNLTREILNIPKDFRNTA